MTRGKCITPISRLPVLKVLLWRSIQRLTPTHWSQMRGLVIRLRNLKGADNVAPRRNRKKMQPSARSSPSVPSWVSNVSKRGHSSRSCKSNFLFIVTTRGNSAFNGGEGCSMIIKVSAHTSTIPNALLRLGKHARTSMQPAEILTMPRNRLVRGSDGCSRSSAPLRRQNYDGLRSRG